MLWINGRKVELKFFPDGTLNLNNCCPVFEEWEQYGSPDDCTISWQYREETECMALFHLTHHVRDAFLVPNVFLEMPYLPNARMDRTHADHEVFTLKYFAKFINALEFKAIVCWDIHSNVGDALIERLIHSGPTHLHKEVVDDYLPSIICYPDAGAMKRYTNPIGLPAIYCEKVRDWETGKILGMNLINPHNINLTGRKVLIIDDICSRGGTFLGAATELKKAGAADVALCVTHLENTVFTGVLLSEDSPISRIYTTNSIYHADHDKITTYDCFSEEVEDQ